MTAGRPRAAGLRATARSMRWTPLAAAVVVVTGAFAATAGLGPLDTVTSVVWLRLAAVGLAVGAAVLLDDEAATTIEPSPTGLLARRARRLVLAVPAVAAGWVAILAVAAARAATAADVPLPGLTVEAVALTVVGLAAASAATERVPERLGGMAGGPAVLALAGGALAADRWLHLFALPAEADWQASRLRWVAVLVGGAVLLAATSLDPARRRWRGSTEPGWSIGRTKNL